MRTKLVWMALAVALVAITAARADVATPRPKWTTVRMAAEQVNITLGDAKVQVDATFEMQNLGPAATVQMGYPVGQFETALNDFAVAADKEPVGGVRSQTGGSEPAMRRGGFGGGRPGGPAGPAAESYRFEGPYKEWKVFNVPFAADQKRTIRVSYWVAPAKVVDAEKGALLHYAYTLKTGATWKGKIDEAKISVKLGGVSADRLVRVAPSGCQKDATGLSWTLKDFKPTDDIEITFRPAAVTAASAK